jgi:hypothetical protein
VSNGSQDGVKLVDYELPFYPDEICKEMRFRIIYEDSDGSYPLKCKCDDNTFVVQRPDDWINHITQFVKFHCITLINKRSSRKQQ